MREWFRFWGPLLLVLLLAGVFFATLLTIILGHPIPARCR